jgi:hypothetical protein
MPAIRRKATLADLAQSHGRTLVYNATQYYHPDQSVTVRIQVFNRGLCRYHLLGSGAPTFFIGGGSAPLNFLSAVRDF